MKRKRPGFDIFTDPPAVSARRGWWLLVAVVVAWLLWMTLRPDNTPNTINLVPLAEHGSALACLADTSCLFQQRAFWFLLVDVAGNIFVIIPAGFGLAGALHRANPWQTIRRVALAGFMLSLVIELIQLTIPSRATDVDDLIFNTLGAVLGALLFLILYTTRQNIYEKV
jgi:glycopeptide antibiotics resistance protein